MGLLFVVSSFASAILEIVVSCSSTSRAGMLDLKVDGFVCARKDDKAMASAWLDREMIQYQPFRDSRDGARDSAISARSKEYIIDFWRLCGPLHFSGLGNLAQTRM